MPETLYTVEEAAQRLKMHPDTLRRQLRAGRIRSVRTGKLWRIPESVLTAPDQPGASVSTPVVAAGYPDVPGVDVAALLAPPTPEEIASRLAALATIGQGITCGRLRDDDPTAGVRDADDERARQIMEAGR